MSNNTWVGVIHLTNLSKARPTKVFVNEVNNYLSNNAILGGISFGKF